MMINFKTSLERERSDWLSEGVGRGERERGATNRFNEFRHDMSDLLFRKILTYNIGICISRILDYYVNVCR